MKRYLLFMGLLLQNARRYAMQIKFRRPTWLHWDITNLVEGWVDGSVPDHGVLLKRTNDGSGVTSFGYTTPELLVIQACAPLEITYYVL